MEIHQSDQRNLVYILGGYSLAHVADGKQCFAWFPAQHNLVRRSVYECADDCVDYRTIPKMDAVRLIRTQERASAIRCSPTLLSGIFYLGSIHRQLEIWECEFGRLDRYKFPDS